MSRSGAAWGLGMKGEEEERWKQVTEERRKEKGKENKNG
jgi:hypothetical protein